MHYHMNDEDKALPVRLRGRIAAKKLVLGYAREMTKALDAGLRLGFAEEVVDQEEDLEALRAQARALLHTDKPEAAAVAGAGK